MRLPFPVLLVALLVGCGGGPQRLLTGLDRSEDWLNFEPLAADAQHAYLVARDESGSLGLEQVPISGDAPTVLLANQAAGSLSVDSRFLYWSDGRNVGAIPLDGGTANLLDTGSTGYSVQDLGPSGGDRLFWVVNSSDPSSSSSGILRGYPAEQNVASLGIADFSGPAFKLATDQDALYWASPEGVFTRGNDDAYGTPITAFSDSASPSDDVVADGTNVYWDQYEGTTAEIRVAPRTGGPSSRVVSFPGAIRRIGVDSKYVYWRAPRCILRAPISGGPPEQIATVVEDGFNFSVSGGGVFWIDSGALYRLSTDGLEGKEPDPGCGT